MSADPISAAVSTLGQAGGASAPSYGFSLGNVSGFEAAMTRAGQGAAGPAATGAPAISSPAMQSLMKPFAHLSSEAAQLSAKAQTISQSGAAMTPGDMIMLTVRCQEFMFHCQLTSNVANRTSDGLQQLFRQQG
jgi:hypothetical protein